MFLIMKESACSRMIVSWYFVHRFHYVLLHHVPNGRSREGGEKSGQGCSAGVRQ